MKWILMSVCVVLATGSYAAVNSNKTVSPVAPASKVSAQKSKPASAKSKPAAPVVPVVAPVVAVEPVVIDPAEAVRGALASLTNKDTVAAEVVLPTIKHPAAALYLKASIEKAKGDPEAAIQTASQVLALSFTEQDWTAKSELLIASLYVELGLLSEADVTASHVQTLYTEPDVIKEADALRSQIEKLKEKLKETRTE